MSILEKIGLFLYEVVGKAACALGLHAQGHIQHLGGELRSICTRCGRA